MMDRAVFMTPDYVADIFGAFARLPRKMDLCWHIRGELATDLTFKPFDFPKPVERGYVELADPRHTQTDKAWSASFTREGKTARFLAAGGTETNVIVGAGHLGLERPTTIIQRRNVASTVYGNVVDISGAKDGYVKGVEIEGGLDKGYALMKIKTPTGEDLCFVSYRPGKYKVGGIETDAQQAMVLMDGIHVRAMYLGGGRVLRVGGRASIHRSPPGLRIDPGLAFVEKMETGAYVLGNPSPSEAEISIDLSPLKGGEAYALDAAGKRAGEANCPLSPGVGIRHTLMKPGARIEFAAKGATSVYEHRQAMLRKRQQEQEDALKKAENDCRARTAARQAAAKANPLPAGTLVVLQAEAFSNEGGGKVDVNDKKRGAVGKAFLGWDTVGHWIEWTLDAPADGYYNLTVCYCTELDKCERELKVNGELAEPFAPVVFPSTGGWANSSDDWRLYTATNPVSQKPLLIKLTKGKNVIRLTNANGRGVNVDYVAVHSPDVTPTREMLAEKLK